jgi:hypothetical protein
MYEWQNLHAGHYALGIEPSTNHVLGKDFARERGELIWLEHGEERRYDSVFRILPDAGRGGRGGEAASRASPVSRRGIPAPTGVYPAIGEPLRWPRSWIWTARSSSTPARPAAWVCRRRCLKLMQRGATVVAVDNDPAKVAALEAAAAKVAAGRLVVSTADLSDLEGFRAVLKACWAKSAASTW